MLDKLPPPPANRSGWPWTVESDLLPETQPDGRPWPVISIVTPSFNQVSFIEETIRSILLQNYQNLEYIIIDGGSTDGTVEVIKKYETWLTYWVSEPDKGQSNAINKGFKRAKGTWGNWICSDDMLCNNALNLLAPQISTLNRFIVFGQGFRINENSEVINEVGQSDIRTFEQLVNLRKYWRKGNSLFQPGALFLLEDVKRINFLDENNHQTMDYDLWGKLLIAGNGIFQSQNRVGYFRWYQGQKTSASTDVTRSLVKTAIKLIKLNSHTGSWMKFRLILRVWYYIVIFNYHRFRSFLGFRRRLKSFINA